MKTSFIVHCLVAVSFALIGARAVAHEGHDAPGALPPAPNGGRVKEAEHQVKHAEDANEDELFFEAVYKNGQIRIYGLTLSPKDTTMFKPVAPNQLTKVEVSVELPRKKQKMPIKVREENGGFVGEFRPTGGGRFLVKVAVMHRNEPKEASIQLENL